MSHDRQPHRIRYEHALRIIGRQLDVAPVYGLSVREGPEGFAVHSNVGTPQQRQSSLSWEQLHNMAIFDSLGRVLGPRAAGPGAGCPYLPTSHEDMFRALGHELDARKAVHVSIDKGPEGLFLAFVAPDETGDYTREDHHYRFADLESLLVQARGRRRIAKVPLRRAEVVKDGPILGHWTALKAE